MLLWQQAAMKWMQDNIEEYRDRITGEVNATKLAKGCGWFCPYFSGARSILQDILEDNLLEIAFAVVEQDANQMTEAEAKIEDYGGE